MATVNKFKYLFEKYRILEMGRAFPAQKSCTSRDSVTSQSYAVSAGNQDIRHSIVAPSYSIHTSHCDCATAI